ncbi:membrane protein [Parapedobacter defluvii]|uniref:Membrane protein n=1 Tax=Parapedobacter defluvii TaxID=2045106 RepID=A0ABQ1LGW6_9SPHI|nr:RagB/SusD family nutrient uptake outer membrane protein [Parapedobacter defluvii]GGC23700.1 membrane protein [Parapedobacter defluvii]
MKRIFIYLVFFGLLALSGCEKYLERQPDDALTAADIFLKEESTREYLMNVYSYMPRENEHNGDFHPWEGSSDEATIAYIGRPFAAINQDLWSPSSNNYSNRFYDQYYKGIREATYFMQHVFESPLSETEAAIWYSEARFLRAFYYYNLMRLYGPVFLLGDELVDFNDPNLGDRERNTWDECVNFVVAELDASAEQLPASWGAEWWGRATKGAAMATKARLLLYAARPLFNGADIYKGVIGRNGPLFPTGYDAGKWQLAAAANKAVIDLGRYSLMGEREMDNADYDPYAALHDLYNTRTGENTEYIFTMEGSAYGFRRNSSPQVVQGYGGVGLTQKLVDAFAMDNGRYPITGYTNSGAVPVIDPQSNYSETGFSMFRHPIFGVELNTFKMYQNREPRFYRNIFWSGLPWIDGNGARKIDDIQFYRNGNSGPGTSHNYPPTGYTGQKFIDPTVSYRSDNWGILSWPVFRYAETLLNYVEALNEYDPQHADILFYLNKVRRRAGVPNIEEIYPDAVGNQQHMRELIRHERFIELCFENNRFFDTRTWMIAEEENNGPIYGMNIWGASNHLPTSDFWKRTVVQQEGGYTGIRIFTPKCYLFPFPEKDVTLMDFTQNLGW